ncbi:hypothetical protein Barb7_02657 [Bacteroidales bacterium Barb7]|nr:hypothetical protein Barb7_02657 [Bacteroidales bacterium Barb7]
MDVSLSAFDLAEYVISRKNKEVAEKAKCLMPNLRRLKNTVELYEINYYIPTPSPNFVSSLHRPASPFATVDRFGRKISRRPYIGEYNYERKLRIYEDEQKEEKDSAERNERKRQNEIKCDEESKLQCIKCIQRSIDEISRIISWETDFNERLPQEKASSNQSSRNNNQSKPTPRNIDKDKLEDYFKSGF